jgi:hypothetical protein
MACLESVARAAGIATRVRALWVDGRFWYPRFRLVQRFIPRKILLIWPQFYLNGQWTDLGEIFAPLPELANQAVTGFTNDGETLFEAVEHTAVDFLGKLHRCHHCQSTTFDLSRYIVADEGLFNTRDEVFARFGTLHDTLQGKVFGLTFGGRKSWGLIRGV